MAKPIQLNPKVRDRKSARVSASALAEFIISTPDQQDRLLHDQRYSSAYVTPKHQQAISVIRSFCVDAARDWSRYDGGRAALDAKSKGVGFTPSQRDEAARCVETLDLFRHHARNTFGVLGNAYCEPPSLAPLSLNGASVSVVPDLIAGADFPPEGDARVGLVFVRVQKRPDPMGCKTDSVREARRAYRREVLSYMLVLGDMALRANGFGDTMIDRKRFRGWDLRLGEEVLFPSDRVSREKRIQAACGQIARLWETINPKPSDLA